MVLVYFIVIILFIIMFIYLILLSTFKIEISNFRASNIKSNKNKIELEDKSTNQISNEYKIKLSLVLFNKLSWLWININDKKMKNIAKKIKWNGIDFKKIEKNFKKDNLIIFKKLKPNLKYLKLDFQIGLKDVILTSFLVTLISSLVSFLIAYLTQNFSKNKYNYKIIPMYLEKNVYKIKLDCIIEIKMVHIINILVYFIKSKKGEKNERRTSNRRPYGYSYE